MTASSRVPVWVSLALILLIGCFALPSTAQVLIVNQDVDHYTSIPLRDMPTVSQSAPVLNREAEPARHIPVLRGLKPAGDPDPVLQRTSVKAPEILAPVQISSFEGLGTGITGFQIVGAPPDNDGAVGLTQYVQWINASIAVFDKATGNMILGPVAGNTVFASLTNNCKTTNDGDPIVNYDRIANRWVISQFAFSIVGGNPAAPVFHCIAVSTTSDATGTYNVYSYQFSNFNDYPKVGVWPDGYYATYNMFDLTTFNFLGSNLCAYDRTAMLAGTAATQICFQQGANVGGALPSDFDGTIAPPAGAPNFMLYGDPNGLELLKFHADFVTPGNSTLTGPITIAVAPFSPLCNTGLCVIQPNTTTRLDPLSDRLMYRLAYRNFGGGHESLVTNHAVDVAGGGGVRWYEIQNPDTTHTLTQQSTYAPDSSFRWMGSIAMDKFGDMAMGYSLSSSTIFPSIAVTGRIPSDPANTMQVETIMMTGTGSQTSSIKGPLNRWGDYTAMQIDPSDDCTFWYTNEFLRTSGVFNWATRIGSFRFPACSGGLRFVPVTPCRVADTRNPAGPFGGPSLVGGAPGRGFAIPNSVCGIPATAQAYSVNVTVVPQGVLGFLTVWPCGQGQPLTSTLNATDGRTKAAAAIVPAGAGGAICNFATNNTDLVIDIDGYFVPASAPTALTFFPLAPCRLVDTRNAAGALGGPSLVANTPRSLPLLSSPCAVPATAQAYSLNFTSVPKGPLGFLTVWPTGQSQPLVSTLNAPTGATTANAAIVPAGTAGAINVFATDASDLVIDINGYFAPSAPGGLSLYNVSPCRIIDTRNPAGSPPFNGALDVNALTSGCDAPSTAQALIVNATVVPPGQLGFLTLWPQGATQPLVSTLNAQDGAITSNMAIIPTTNGSVSAFGSSSTHLILDLFGYFAP